VHYHWQPIHKVPHHKSRLSQWQEELIFDRFQSFADMINYYANTKVSIRFYTVVTRILVSLLTWSATVHACSAALCTVCNNTKTDELHD